MLVSGGLCWHRKTPLRGGCVAALRLSGKPKDICMSLSIFMLLDMESKAVVVDSRRILKSLSK